MSMTPEGRVKSKVRDLLRSVGAWYVTPIASAYSRAGVPDYIACHQGRFIAIECKAGKGKTTKPRAPPPPPPPPRPPAASPGSRCRKS